jgi:hypothetical protein
MLSFRSLRFAPLGAVFCACYSYAPVETGALPQGANVRARVTSTAATRIAPLLGTSESRVLIGSLVSQNAQGMVIEVPTAASTGMGSSMQTLYQRVSLAPADVTEMETRTLDRTRTAAVVGAGVAVAASVAIAALRGGPGTDRPPTGGPSEHRIPLLKFHF